MKLLVLDGNSIVNRAFYGVKLLSTTEGLFTNGIYGFLTMLQKVKDETQPDGVAIAFDLKAPTFRHKMYAGYKANRKGMPPELAQQMPTLKELLRDLGYTLVECEGWEADDILGTLARSCENTGNQCVIATGDRDSLQLVSSQVSVRLASTKFGQPQTTLYDEDKIREEYGVSPQQMIDIKAIQGDSSDNIPGVAGIGPKGAGELVQKFGSLSYIYEHLDELDIKPGMRKKLEAGKESAFLSYELGTIRRDAPIDTKVEDYLPKEGDRPAAARLMAKLELFSLLKKLELEEAVPAQAQTDESAELPVPEIREYEDGASLLPLLEEQERADFLPLYGQDGSIQFVLLNYKNTIYKIHADTAFLRALCKNPRIRKNTHDSKPLFAALEKLPSTALEMGIPYEGAGMDTLLAAYLLNPSASGYGVLRLAQEYQIPIPALEDEDCRAAAVLPALCDRLGRAIDENDQRSLLETIEMPLARVLARMESVGFAVDAQGIREFGVTLQKEINEVQAVILEEVGYEFNINSPKQLGDALFGKLGLPHGKKTKTGYSTNVDVLEKLRYEHPVVDRVLRYRTLTKLKSTYCDGLLKVIGEDGRIHSSFNQTETRTGRISSTEPNLQNIPVRTELGRELRRFFAARPGWVLVDADYSQIELRVLAHVANDKNMIDAFLNGEDIHRATAAQVFHMPPEMVTPLMRSRAKAVNFGIVYGIGAFSLSQDIGVSRKEAAEYIDAYLEHYSGVRDYMEQAVAQAKDKGYSETIFGRRRYLPELSSSNFNMRAFGERVARNMPIQGAAADIIKIAMIRVENRLEKEKLRARLILQVHDELIVEAPEEEAQQVAALLKEEMESAVQLSVPMVADANIGRTWYDAKG